MPTATRCEHLLANVSEQRQATFRQILEELAKRTEPVYIVESGCVRNETWNDGRSTVLFDSFVWTHGGKVTSIDKSAEHCAYARTQVGELTEVVCGDGVRELLRISRLCPATIDLLYLDSFDLDWDDPHPSALHHLHEFCAAMPALKPGAIIAVDDHRDDQGRLGKSKYIVPFMDEIGAGKLFEEYQIGWRMP